MKKWIAILLSAVMLMGILAGCKKEEVDLTPDDQMTIAISALARSVKALKTQGSKPVRYTVTNVRTINGKKTLESTSSYDTEKLFAVVENRYFQDATQTGSETIYTFVVSHLVENNESYQIVSAKITTENDITTKEYSILYTANNLQDVQSAWDEGKYGADMTYQTYGRMEKLIVDAALSQGGAEAKVTSADDYTLTISVDHKTECYTVEDNYITKWVWTEWTTNGEDESTWEYFWNITDVTLPDLADFTLVTE